MVRAQYRHQLAHAAAGKRLHPRAGGGEILRDGIERIGLIGAGENEMAARSEDRVCGESCGRRFEKCAARARERPNRGIAVGLCEQRG
jgi:hypothetical protein